MPSQEDQIFLHLVKYGKIDAMEALKKYNCFFYPREYLI